MKDKAQLVLRKPLIAARTLMESILTQYDGIIVMKDGTVVESGTFENLMEQKDDFFALYKAAR